MWGFLSLFVCVIGAIVYIASANPKLSEIGRLSYWVGLLAFLLQNGTHIVSLGK